MKHLKFMLVNIVVVTFLYAALIQAKELPILEPNLVDLSPEDATLVIESMLNIGHQSFDFSHIGKHINLFKQIAQASNKKIVIVGAQLQDLKELKAEFGCSAGIAWSENGIGKSQLTELKNNRFLFDEGDQGVNQQSVNPLFFEDKKNIFFKLSFDLAQKINVNDLLHKVLILHDLKGKGKATPIVSLPVQDGAYTNVDPALLTIAQDFDSKLYQVLFSLLNQMGIHIIPVITKPVTPELSQEMMNSFELRFNSDQWSSLKHLPRLEARL